MYRIGHLPVILGLFMAVLLAAGCGRHVMSEQGLASVDMPDGYSQLIQNPPANVGKTMLLGGFIVENHLSRDGTTLRIKPYTLDGQGRPKHLIQDGEEYLARTDRLLLPDNFGPGHMVTLIATYQGLNPRENEGKVFRRMLFEIREIRSWPPPAHYPYGYHYPFRIY